MKLSLFGKGKKRPDVVQAIILPPEPPPVTTLAKEAPIRGRHLAEPMPPKPKEKFAPGTLVRLPSGSPIMTSSGRHPQDHNCIQCFWFDPKEHTHRTLNFPKDALIEVTLPVAEAMRLMGSTEMDGEQYQQFLALADAWSRKQNI